MMRSPPDSTQKVQEGETPQQQNWAAGPNSNPANEQRTRDGAEQQEKKDGYVARFFKFVHANEKEIVALSTVAIAAFTIVLAFATAFLWKATRDLVHETEAHGERTVRAYLGLEIASVFLDSPAPNHVTAWVRFKNVGTSPAYKLSGWLKFGGKPMGQSPWNEIGKAENGGVMNPGQTFNFNSNPLKYTTEDLQKITNNEMGLYVWGRVDFVDAFDKPRFFEYRGIMSGPPETVIMDGARTLGWGFKPIENGVNAN